MMEFVLLALTITVSILLASAISMVVMFKLLSSKKVIKWYMKWFVNYMKAFDDFDFQEMEKEL